MAPLVSRRDELEDLVRQWSIDRNIDPAFTSSIIEQESNWDPMAESPKGAQGLMQLMPLIQNAYGVKDPFDPEDNVRGGLRFLDVLFNKYGDDKEKVVAAYNAGETEVNKYDGVPPFPETQDYVNRVLGERLPRYAQRYAPEVEEEEEEVAPAAPVRRAAAVERVDPIQDVFASYRARHGITPRKRREEFAAPQEIEVPEGLYRLVLPDGSTTDVPNEMSEKDAMDLAKGRFPQAFAIYADIERAGGDSGPLDAFWASANRSWHSIFPALGAAYAHFTDDEELYDYYHQQMAEASEAAGKIAPNLVSLDDISETYDKDGLFPAIAQLVELGAEQIGSSFGFQAPSIAAGLGGWFLGGAAASLLAAGGATAAVPVGLIAGIAAFGTMWATFLGQDLERGYSEGQKHDIEDLDLLGVASASFGQTALNALSYLVLGGYAGTVGVREMIRGTTKAVGGAGATRAAMAPALSTHARQVAVGSFAKALTSLNLMHPVKRAMALIVEEEIAEVGQQALERAAAGLSVDPRDQDALDEYIETMIMVFFPTLGMAGLGGVSMAWNKSKQDKLHRGLQETRDIRASVYRRLIDRAGQEEATILEERVKAMPDEEVRQLDRLLAQQDITPTDIHNLAKDRNILSDNDSAFMAATRRITGKYHLDDVAAQDTKKAKSDMEAMYAYLFAMPRQEIDTRLLMATDEEVRDVIGSIEDEKIRDGSNTSITRDNIKKRLKLKFADTPDRLANELSDHYQTRMRDLGLVVNAPFAKDLHDRSPRVSQELSGKGKKKLPKGVDEKKYQQVMAFWRENGREPDTDRGGEYDKLFKIRSMNAINRLREYAVERGDITHQTYQVGSIRGDVYEYNESRIDPTSGRQALGLPAVTYQVEVDGVPRTSVYGTRDEANVAADRERRDSLVDPDSISVNVVESSKPLVSQAIRYEAVKGAPEKSRSKAQPVAIVRNAKTGKMARIFTGKTLNTAQRAARKYIKNRSDNVQTVYRVDVDGQPGISHPDQALANQARKKLVQESKGVSPKPKIIVRPQRVAPDLALDTENTSGYVVRETRTREDGTATRSVPVGVYNSYRRAQAASEKANEGRIGMSSMGGKLSRNLAARAAQQAAMLDPKAEALRRAEQAVDRKASASRAEKRAKLDEDIKTLAEVEKLDEDILRSLVNLPVKGRSKQQQARVDDVVGVLQVALARTGGDTVLVRMRDSLGNLSPDAHFVSAAKMIEIAMDPAFQTRTVEENVERALPFLTHETVHHLRQMEAISTAEWKSLKRWAKENYISDTRLAETNALQAAAGLRQFGKNELTYADYANRKYAKVAAEARKPTKEAPNGYAWTEDDFIEEAIAFAWQDNHAARLAKERGSKGDATEATAPGIFTRFIELMRRIGRALTGRGWKSADEVFELMYGDTFSQRVNAGKVLDPWWTTREESAEFKDLKAWADMHNMAVWGVPTGRVSVVDPTDIPEAEKKALEEIRSAAREPSPARAALGVGEARIPKVGTRAEVDESLRSLKDLGVDLDARGIRASDATFESVTPEVDDKEFVAVTYPDGTEVLFYMSDGGTDGKVQGQWYPTPGRVVEGVPGRNFPIDWVVKDPDVNEHYGSGVFMDTAREILNRAYVRDGRILIAADRRPAGLPDTRVYVAAKNLGMPVGEYMDSPTFSRDQADGMLPGRDLQAALQRRAAKEARPTPARAALAPGVGDYNIGSEAQVYEIEDRSEQGEGIELDIFDPPSAPHRAALRPESFPEVGLVQSGTLRSGITRATTPEEIAHIAAPLRKEAQENFVVVVTDADGEVLRVIRGSLGAITSTLVHPIVTLAPAFNVPGASKLWIVHNHPSGSTNPSKEDTLMGERLSEVVEGSGIELEASIIVAPGGRASSQNLPFFKAPRARGETKQFRIPPLPRDRVLGIFERRFKKVAPSDRERVRNSSDLRNATEDMRDRGETGVLFLNQYHHVVGVLPMSVGEMGSLRTGDPSTGKGAFLAEAEKRNASAMVVIVPSITGHLTNESDIGLFNLAGFGKTAGIEMLDGISLSGDTVKENRDAIIQLNMTHDSVGRRWKRGDKGPETLQHGKVREPTPTRDALSDRLLGGTFYSNMGLQLSNIVEGVGPKGKKVQPQVKMTPGDLKKRLLAMGVTKEDIFWTGFDNYVADKKSVNLIDTMVSLEQLQVVEELFGAAEVSVEDRAIQREALVGAEIRRREGDYEIVGRSPFISEDEGAALEDDTNLYDSTIPVPSPRRDDLNLDLDAMTVGGVESAVDEAISQQAGEDQVWAIARVSDRVEVPSETGFGTVIEPRITTWPWEREFYLENEVEQLQTWDDLPVDFGTGEDGLQPKTYTSSADARAALLTNLRRDAMRLSSEVLAERNAQAAIDANFDFLHLPALAPGILPSGHLQYSGYIIGNENTTQYQRELVIQMPIKVTPADTTGWTAEYKPAVESVETGWSTPASYVVNDQFGTTIEALDEGQQPRRRKAGNIFVPPAMVTSPEEAIAYVASGVMGKTEPGIYPAGHSSFSANTLFWIRFNERMGPNGERILFIEEMQSDWDQRRAYIEGQKRQLKAVEKEQRDRIRAWFGLNTDSAAHKRLQDDDALDHFMASALLGDYDNFGLRDNHANWLNIAADDFKTDGAYRGAVTDAEGRSVGGAELPAFSLDWGTDEHVIWGVLSRTRSRYSSRVRDSLERHGAWDRDKGVDSSLPEAPFQNNLNWVKVAIKRMVGWAAEHNYDAIAWATPEQLTKRYDGGMGTVVDKIEWRTVRRRPDPTFPAPEHRVYSETFWNPAKKEVSRRSVVAEGRKKIFGSRVTGRGSRLRWEAIVYPDGMVDGSTITRLNGQYLSNVIGEKMAKEVLAGKKGSIEGDELTVGSGLFKSIYGKVPSQTVKDLNSVLTKAEREEFGVRGGKIEIFPTVQELPTSGFYANDWVIDGTRYDPYKAEPNETVGKLVRQALMAYSDIKGSLAKQLLEDRQLVDEDLGMTRPGFEGAKADIEQIRLLAAGDAEASLANSAWNLRDGASRDTRLSRSYRTLIEELRKRLRERGPVTPDNPEVIAYKLVADSSRGELFVEPALIEIQVPRNLQRITARIGERPTEKSYQELSEMIKAERDDYVFKRKMWKRRVRSLLQRDLMDGALPEFSQEQYTDERFSYGAAIGIDGIVHHGLAMLRMQSGQLHGVAPGSNAAKMEMRREKRYDLNDAREHLLLFDTEIIAELQDTSSGLSSTAASSDKAATKIESLIGKNIVADMSLGKSNVVRLSPKFREKVLEHGYAMHRKALAPAALGPITREGVLSRTTPVRYARDKAPDRVMTDERRALVARRTRDEVGLTKLDREYMTEDEIREHEDWAERADEELTAYTRESKFVRDFDADVQDFVPVPGMAQSTEELEAELVELESRITKRFMRENPDAVVLIRAAIEETKQKIIENDTWGVIPIEPDGSMMTQYQKRPVDIPPQLKDFPPSERVETRVGPMGEVVTRIGGQEVDMPGPSVGEVNVTEEIAAALGAEQARGIGTVRGDVRGYRVMLRKGHHESLEEVQAVRGASGRPQGFGWAHIELPHGRAVTRDTNYSSIGTMIEDFLEKIEHSDTNRVFVTQEIVATVPAKNKLAFIWSNPEFREPQVIVLEFREAEKIYQLSDAYSGWMYGTKWNEESRPQPDADLIVRSQNKAWAQAKLQRVVAPISQGTGPLDVKVRKGRFGMPARKIREPRAFFGEDVPSAARFAAKSVERREAWEAKQEKWADEKAMRLPDPSTVAGQQEIDERKRIDKLRDKRGVDEEAVPPYGGRTPVRHAVNGVPDDFTQAQKDIVEKFHLGGNPVPNPPTTLWARASAGMTVLDKAWKTRLMMMFVNKYERLVQMGRLIADKYGVQLLADASVASSAMMIDRSAGFLAGALRYGIPVYIDTGTQEVGKHKLRTGYTRINQEKLETTASKVLVGWSGDNIKGELDERTFHVPNMYDEKTGGLIPILTPLAAKKLISSFFAYTRAKRAFRIKREGKPVAWTWAEIREGLALAEQHPEIAVAHHNLQNWNNGLVKYMRDTGVLTKEMADEWMDTSDYIPFFLEIEREGKSAITNLFKQELGKPLEQNILDSLMVASIPSKKLRGVAPKEELMEPIEAIVKNAMVLITAGLKNVAVNRAVDQGVMLDMAKERTDWDPDTSEARGVRGPDVMVFRDGVRKGYDISDPLLHETIVGSFEGNDPGFDTMVSILGKPARWLREMVTRSPGFLAANLLRDSLSVWAMGGGHKVPLWKSIGRLGKNLGKMRKGETTDTYRLLELGGAIGGWELAGVDPKRMKRIFMSELGEGPKLSSPFWALWDFLGEASARSEAANRELIYEQTYARVVVQLRNDFKSENNRNPNEEEDSKIRARAENEANFQALEVLNFSRRGNSYAARFLAGTVPFLNARVQGLHRLGRVAIHGEGLTGETTAWDVQKILLRRGFYMASVSMLYALMMYDDEDFENIRPEIRNQNWLLPIHPDYFLAVPIPFEVGVLFKVIPEEITRAMLGNTGRDQVESLKHSLWETLAFNPIPQAFKPLVEMWANKNFFTGEAIVPYYMGGMDADMQKRASTPLAAQAMGWVTGSSPLHMENLWRGYTGTLGVMLMNTLDAATHLPGMEALGVTPSDVRWNNMPIVKRFIKDQLEGGLKNQYYDLREQVHGLVQTVNALNQEGRHEDAQKRIEKNKGIYALRGIVNMMNRQLDAIRKQRKLVVLIPGKQISGAERQARLEKLERQENDLLRRLPELRRGASMKWPSVWPGVD